MTWDLDSLASTMLSWWLFGWMLALISGHTNSWLTWPGLGSLLWKGSYGFAGFPKGVVRGRGDRFNLCSYDQLDFRISQATRGHPQNSWWLSNSVRKGILGDANQDPFSAIRWVFRRFEPDLKPERSWQTSDERRWIFNFSNITYCVEVVQSFGKRRPCRFKNLVDLGCLRFARRQDPWCNINSGTCEWSPLALGSQNAGSRWN